MFLQILSLMDLLYLRLVGHEVACPHLEKQKKQHEYIGKESVVVEWICHWTVDHKVHGSSRAAALMSFDKTLIYICHSGKMTPGWNAPQEVENVHTLCAGKPEPDDQGNNIYL